MDRLCSHCIRKLSALGEVHVPYRVAFFDFLETTRHNPAQRQNRARSQNGSLTREPSGGAPTLSNLSEPISDSSKDDETKSDAGVLSSYAISSHSKTTDLRETLALQPHREGSISTGAGKSLDGDRKGHDGKSEQDRPTVKEDGGPGGDKSMSGEHEHGTDAKNNSTKVEPKAMKECLAEACTYHAFYDEVGTLGCTSQNLPITLKSFNAPTCEATTRGAAKIAWNYPQNLASPFGYAYRPCSCFQQCSNLQAESSV